MHISGLLVLLTLPVIVYAARGHHHSHQIPSDSKEDLNPKKTHSRHSHGRNVTVAAKLKPTHQPQGDDPPSLLKYLKPHQKVLFDRAMQHDFDFAQFSKPCKVYSVDELEAYLEAIEATMEHAEASPINPEKVGNQLENIFNQSVEICDYRNFLTCHKTLLTCACALRSMGVNHDGICGVKMNFPCKISKRKLERHGIPARVKSRPVQCLSENAECGSESDKHISGNKTVSLRTICKCRNGFWGPSCSGQDKSDESKLTVVETTDGKVNDGDTLADISTAMEEDQAIRLKDGVMTVPITDTKRTAKRQSVPEKIGFMDIADNIAGKGFKDSKNYQNADTEAELKRPDKGNENSVVISNNVKSGESEVTNYFLIRSSDEPTGEGEVRNYFLIRTLDDPNEVNKAKLNNPSGTGDNNLTEKQKEAYKHEILHMLKDILETRGLPFNHSCFYDDDKTLSEIFPLLPLYNLIELDKPLDITYSILSRLYWKGIAFCNRKNMLKCTASHVCGCAEDFGLIEEGGECRLKEGTHCSRDDLPGRETSRDFLPNVKKKKKFFQCQNGTVCRQFDFGLPLCVKIVGGEDEDYSGQRSDSDGSADKNGGESIHLGNSILLINVVVILTFS